MLIFAYCSECSIRASSIIIAADLLGAPFNGNILADLCNQEITPGIFYGYSNRPRSGRIAPKGPEGKLKGNQYARLFPLLASTYLSHKIPTHLLHITKRDLLKP